MKNRSILFSICLLFVLSGCIADVTEQSIERISAASGKGLMHVSFDASIYRQTFAVTGSPADTLIADGIFSLWSPGSSKSSELSQNVTMNWVIDTVHYGQLVAFAEGPEAELLSIDKMTATIPAKVNLAVTSSSNDVTIQNMKGDINVYGTSSNVTFTTDGRMTLQTSSGDITGSSGLGGSVKSTSGNILISALSKNFEAVYAEDSTGNVSLHIPGGEGITFKLYTNGGNISLNYDNLSKSSISAIEITANGGGKVVRVATATGKISVSN